MRVEGVPQTLPTSSMIPAFSRICLIRLPGMDLETAVPAVPFLSITGTPCLVAIVGTLAFQDTLLVHVHVLLHGFRITPGPCRPARSCLPVVPPMQNTV